MRASEKAWFSIALGVLVYEVAAPEGELLSHAFDRFLDRHPYLTWVATVALAAHLLNVMPPKVDPLAQLHEVREKLRGA